MDYSYYADAQYPVAYLLARRDDAGKVEYFSGAVFDWKATSDPWKLDADLMKGNMAPVSEDEAMLIAESIRAASGSRQGHN